MRYKRGILGLFLLGGVVVGLVRQFKMSPGGSGELGDDDKSRNDTSTDDTPGDQAFQLATFAAGCFWCSEAAFQEEPGVVDAVVGYAGGTEAYPTYEQVSAHATSHREAVQVQYDPQRISYDRLLEIFWQQIDPTDAEGQFVDKGFQYTTAIFAHTPEQQALAEASKTSLEGSGRFEKPIVTVILPYTTFYAAEEYHQDFYKHAAERYQSYKEHSGRKEYRGRMSQSAAGNESSHDDLKVRLTPQQRYVTQEDGTDVPFENEYRDTKQEGLYVDVVTGEPLFSSLHKYDSGTGWPSFTQPIEPVAVTLHGDLSLGMERTEVRNKHNNSHLGHAFMDGPIEDGGVRYCINSSALKFIPKESLEAEGYGDRLYLFENSGK